MLYGMVIAALTILPWKLGGYARVFELANSALTKHGASIYLKPQHDLGYSTLAVGRAISLMLYPHTPAAVLSAQPADAVRRNESMPPADVCLVGLVPPRV